MVARPSRRLLYSVLVIAVLAGAVVAAAFLIERNPRTRTALKDGWLHTKVTLQFMADTDVDADRIRVTASDGVLTLSGEVADQDAKQQALMIASTTDGVNTVVDRMWTRAESAGTSGWQLGAEPAEPERSTSAAPSTETTTATVGTTAAYDPWSDEAITDRIQAAYFRDPDLKREAIQVTTRQGVVRLRGSVATEAQREEAEAVAIAMSGVERVDTSELTISAPAGAVPGPPPSVTPGVPDLPTVP